MTRVEQNLEKTLRNIRFDKCPGQHCNVVYLRTRLHVGIIANEQIRQDFHERLSELFLLRHAGHTEHPDWKSS